MAPPRRSPRLQARCHADRTVGSHIDYLLQACSELPEGPAIRVVVRRRPQLYNVLRELIVIVWFRALLFLVYLRYLIKTWHYGSRE